MQVLAGGYLFSSIAGINAIVKTIDPNEKTISCQ
jgi:hypothetical protein